MQRVLQVPLVLGLACLAVDRVSAQDTTAAAASAVSVEAAVGTSVAEKALVGAAESFPKGTTSLVCFSKVTGATDSEIEHAWYQGDAEVSRVKLAIKGSPFRTWSRKSIPENATGDWRCDVLHAGKVLQSVKFKVE